MLCWHVLWMGSWRCLITQDVSLFFLTNDTQLNVWRAKNFFKCFIYLFLPYQKKMFIHLYQLQIFISLLLYFSLRYVPKYIGNPRFNFLSQTFMSFISGLCVCPPLQAKIVRSLIEHGISQNYFRSLFWTSVLPYFKV